MDSRIGMVSADSSLSLQLTSPNVIFQPLYFVICACGDKLMRHIWLSYPPFHGFFFGSSEISLNRIQGVAPGMGVHEMAAGTQAASCQCPDDCSLTAGMHQIH